jgi:hypothetical protein
MQWKKMLLAIIIGIVLLITDIRFGWMSVHVSGIWTLFIIIFVVGLLAGDISGGFVGALLTELLGVGIMAIIPGILFPEVSITATDILSRMWLVMALSLSYSMRFPDAPVPWIEGLVIIILLVALAPLVYLMALFFGLIGGLLGRFIHPLVFKSKESPAPVASQQTQQAPPAPEPYPPPEEDIPEVEEVEEELGEVEGAGLEPSE